MANDDETRSILAGHKRWADGLCLIWIIISIGVFVGGHFLMEELAADPLDRVQAFILLSTIILASIVCQVAGLIVARLEIISRAR